MSAVFVGLTALAALLNAATAEVFVPVVIAALSGGGIGSIITARVAARRNSFDELRGIIDEQQGYIDRLTARVDRLEAENATLRCELDQLRRG